MIPLKLKHGFYFTNHFVGCQFIMNRQFVGKSDLPELIIDRDRFHFTWQCITKKLTYRRIQSAEHIVVFTGNDLASFLNRSENCFPIQWLDGMNVNYLSVDAVGLELFGRPKRRLNHETGRQDRNVAAGAQCIRLKKIEAILLIMNRRALAARHAQVERAVMIRDLFDCLRKLDGHRPARI